MYIYIYVYIYIYISIHIHVYIYIYIACHLSWMPIVFKIVLMAHVPTSQETLCTVCPWSDRLSSSGFSQKFDFNS